MPKYQLRHTNVTIEITKTKEGYVGLSYLMRTKNNYTTWSMKMKVFIMKAQGVWGAIEGDPKIAVDERTVQ